MAKRIITGIDIDFSDIKAAGETRNFTVSGSNAAVFSLEVTSIKTFTDATCDYNNDPTVTCDASTSIIAGSRVAGTGIPGGTTVASVNTAGAVTSMELSASTTGGAVTNGTLGFAAGLADLVSITAEADTAAVDIEMFVAQI